MKKILLLLFLNAQLIFAAPSDDFVILVKTNNPGYTTAEMFRIPTKGSLSYNYNVDCNNDGIDEATGQTGDYYCDYSFTGLNSGAGIYNIRIKDNVGDGTGFPSINFNNTFDRLKIINVVQWGTGKWTNMQRSFYGAENMYAQATDTPDFSHVTTMESMFRRALLANPDTSNWDTSSVTNMKSLFNEAHVATPDTSNWDTHLVTDMSFMFRHAFLATPDTSLWDTSQVIDMTAMFSAASAANPDTSSWNTSQVTSMQSMFNNATSAQPNVGSWDLSQVSDVTNMFTGVTLPTIVYDTILTHFNTNNPQSGLVFHGGSSKYCNVAAHDNLTNTTTGHSWAITDSGLDANCPDPADAFVIEVDTTKVGLTDNLHFKIGTSSSGYNYNVDCDAANLYSNTAAAQTGDYTCQYATPGVYTIRITDNIGDKTGFPRIYNEFNNDANKITDIKQWGTGIWNSMFFAFYLASNMEVTATDIPDLSNVSDMRTMFTGASKANPDTSGWDTSSVTNMSGMFAGASVANPDVSGWDTSNVTNMSGMFDGASVANPDTSAWDTAMVTNMSSMFRMAVNAQPDVSTWNVVQVTDFTNMFAGVSLPTAVYSRLLIEFNDQGLQSGLVFDGGNSYYCGVLATAAHANMLASYSWTINDSGACSVSDPGSDFVFVVKTDNPGYSADDQYKIKIDSSYVSNFNVDCNDDGIDEVTARTSDYTCDYSPSGLNLGAGTYTIRIKDNTGTDDGFPHIQPGVIPGTSGVDDAEKIIELKQWGTNKWQSTSRMFYQAKNMMITAIDVPNLSNVESMYQMFYDNQLAVIDTLFWDVGMVTDMGNLFYNADAANPDVSRWDTSNVTRMSGMFAHTAIANPDVSHWNTSNVTSMWNMFKFTAIANPDVSQWDTSSVQNLSYIFQNAQAAMPDTSMWNTSSVTNMSGMFFNSSFNYIDTNSWDITQVTSMNGMFNFSTLTTANYDEILTNFAGQAVKNNVNFHAGNSLYCSVAAQNARASLITDHNWTITDDGLDANCSDVIFENSFENTVVFKAADKQFVYDFSQVSSLALDDNQLLIARGVDSQNNTVVKIYLRKDLGQLQIRMDRLMGKESETNQWQIGNWQNTDKKNLTVIQWQ